MRISLPSSNYNEHGMSKDRAWAAQAASILFGWSEPLIEFLTGTSESSQVARVMKDSKSVVIKAYDIGRFHRARVLSGLRSYPFAPVIAESSSLQVLAFEDLGRQSLGTALISASSSERRKLAEHYVNLITAAHESLDALGTPAKAGIAATFDEQVGIPRPTSISASWDALTSKLDALAYHSRGAVPNCSVRSGRLSYFSLTAVLMMGST